MDTTVTNVELETTLNISTTSNSTIIHFNDPLNLTTLVVLVAIGTALALVALVLICFGFFMLIRKCKCIKKGKLDMPVVDLDQTDANKRYSTISETNVEVELLKLNTSETPTQPNGVDDKKEKTKEDRKPLVLQELHSPVNHRDVVILEAGNRNSWGQRNTSFRLGTLEREQYVQGLKQKNKAQVAEPEDIDVFDGDDKLVNDTTPLNGIEKPTAVNQQQKIATVQHSPMRRTDSKQPANNQIPLRQSAIHYDVPKINPSPVSIIFVDKKGEIPGMVNTARRHTPPELSPKKVEKEVPPWERYSLSSPVSSEKSFDQRSSIQSEIEALLHRDDARKAGEKQKPKVPAKTISLDGYLRQKSMASTNSPRGTGIRTTIAEENPSSPTKTQSDSTKQVATVKPTSSAEKRNSDAFRAELEQQYGQQGLIYKNRPVSAIKSPTNNNREFKFENGLKKNVNA